VIVFFGSKGQRSRSQQLSGGMNGRRQLVKFRLVSSLCRCEASIDALILSSDTCSVAETLNTSVNSFQCRECCSLSHVMPRLVDLNYDAMLLVNTRRSFITVKHEQFILQPKRWSYISIAKITSLHERSTTV